jgi:hypothetical protein
VPSGENFANMSDASGAAPPSFFAALVPLELWSEGGPPTSTTQ